MLNELWCLLIGVGLSLFFTVLINRLVIDLDKPPLDSFLPNAEQIQREIELMMPTGATPEEEFDWGDDDLEEEGEKKSTTL